MARKSVTHSDPIVSAGAAPARASKPKASRNQTVQPVTEGAVVAQMSASREEIARLAYSYWEARGRNGGCPDEDWLRAEQELRNRRAASASA